MIRFIRRSRWGWLDYSMAWGWVIVLLIWAAPLFGRLEGAVWPVLDPRLTITHYALHPQGTRVMGWAVKRRDCEYVDGSLEWWLGTPGNAVRAAAEFNDPPQIRAQGRTEWEGLVVGLMPRQISTRSFATVRHRCHPLWETETIFYKSGVSE